MNTSFFNKGEVKFLQIKQDTGIRSSSPKRVAQYLRVAQNGRFLSKSVYVKGGTMVPTRGKILDFKISESPKNKLFRTFCSLKLSLKSFIFHFLRTNLPECPRDITLGILILVYSVPQHFLYFRNYKLY